MIRSRGIMWACCVSSTLLLWANTASGQAVAPDAEGFFIATPEDLQPPEGGRSTVHSRQSQGARALRDPDHFRSRGRAAAPTSTIRPGISRSSRAGGGCRPAPEPTSTIPTT